MPTLIARCRRRVNAVPVIHSRREVTTMTPVALRSRRRFRVLLQAALLASPIALGAATVRIIQTNSAGDNIHLIDPVTNTVVAVIDGIEVNHGAAAAPDGSAFYFSNEADHPDWLTYSPDGKSLERGQCGFELRVGG